MRVMPTRTINHASSADHSPGAVNASLCIPEESFLDRRVALLLFLLSLAYLYLFRRYTAMEPDEGIILQGAQRILSGQVLYRDFFSFFTPGSYYLLLVFFGAISSVLNYLLARRVCSRGSAFTIAILVTVTALPFRFLVLHNWDSTLWACLALYCAVRLLESPQWKWAFATGSFAALTFLFEQSKGAGLCLGLGAGLLAICSIDPRAPRLRRNQLAALALGLAWPFLVTFTYFAAQHSFSSMLADWFWPLQHYSLANRVPYGYQNWSDSTRHQLFGTGSLLVRIITALTISPCFGVLDNADVAAASAAAQVRLLRIALLRTIRAVAFSCDRQSGYHSLHVFAAHLLTGACLDS